MENKLLLTLSCCVLFAFGCGVKKKASQNIVYGAHDSIVTDIISTAHQEGDWLIKEKISSDGSVYYKEESIAKENVDEVLRRDHKEVQLSLVPTNPKHNVQLFRISGTDNAIFIAPKVYLYSGSEINRMMPLVNDEDGTMTLIFPIMLVDGLSATIPSPDNLQAPIKLPDNLLVKDMAALNEHINKTYLNYGEQNLSRLAGCPKELIMTVAGREFNIASSILNLSDKCDYNVPIYTSIKLPKKEALWLLQEGLYSGASQITASFETRIPFITSKFSLELNKSKLYEEISTNLSSKRVFTEAEVTEEITKVVRQKIAKISIQSDINLYVSNIIQQAKEQFFIPVPADTTRADMSCGNAPFCLKKNYISKNYSETLKTDWTISSNVLSGQSIMTWAKLFMLSDASVRFNDLSLKNLKRETSLFVLPNDLVELKISKITSEIPSQDSRTTLAHNNAIIGHKTTGGGMGCMSIRPITMSLIRPMRGSEPCNERTVPIYQDQWTEETELFATKSSVVIDNPTGKENLISDEIYFGFSWFEGGKEIVKECPVNLFERQGDGRSLTIRIKNNPKCEIFLKSATNKPKLYIINKFNSTGAEIREGKMTKNWRGEETNTTKYSVHQILNSYHGEVSIRGYRIGNSERSIFGADVKK